MCIHTKNRKIWLKKSTKTKDPGEKGKNRMSRQGPGEPWIPDYHMKSSNNWEKYKMLKTNNDPHKGLLTFFNVANSSSCKDNTKIS